MAEVDRGAGVMFPPPLIFIGLALAGPGIDRLLGLPPLPIPGWLGMIFLIPGLSLIGIAIGLFRRRGENPVPSTPTDGIIDTGIYARTRNPMYLGMAVAYPGIAILLHSMPSLLLLPVAIILVRTQVIAREERYLEAKFGAPYMAYKARVGRWF
jgi:protein-S-isoprenylcysteine O-methyltransferase Ste14